MDPPPNREPPMSPPESVTGLNARPEEELRALLLRCVAVPRWAAELAAARPYADPAAVRVRAAELTAGLSDDEVRQALADHPRIGDRAAGWSRTEQSGVDGSDAVLARELRVANAEYERRFGHLYLVCASGRGGAELLADARARLGNDPVTELAVVRRELAGIAAIRLGRAMTEGADG
jgi:2-oxo-4-hydroxy-4-carboxy-5-ureidoimidazoline decarboxylase